MKFIKLAFIVLSAALFPAACANTAAPVKTTDPAAINDSPANNSSTNQTAKQASAPNDELAAARELYKTQRCVLCHRENGEGGKNISVGDITIGEVPNFKDPHHAREPDSHFIKKIKNGGDGMPKFKDKLSEEEIKSLVKYIRQEFQGKRD